MVSRYIIITLLLTAVFSVAAWETEISVDAGRPHQLSIGMEAGATDGFDKEYDKISPPPPPVGFYCFFPIADTMYDFIDALWGDIRAPAAQASWRLVLKRPETPIKVELTGIPKIGLISVNGVQADAESLTLTFAKQDTLLRIDYTGGFWEEPIETIDFEIPAAASVVIVILNENGNPVRRLPDMRLLAGKHSLGWNGTDNRGEPLPPGKYYAHIRAEWKNELTEMEIEILIDE